MSGEPGIGEPGIGESENQESEDQNKENTCQEFSAPSYAKYLSEHIAEPPDVVACTSGAAAAASGTTGSAPPTLSPTASAHLQRGVGDNLSGALSERYLTRELLTCVFFVLFLRFLALRFSDPWLSDSRFS